MEIVFLCNVSVSLSFFKINKSCAMTSCLTFARDFYYSSGSSTRKTAKNNPRISLSTAYGGRQQKSKEVGQKSKEVGQKSKEVGQKENFRI